MIKYKISILALEVNTDLWHEDYI